jgi:hypothetical protein
MKKPTKEYNAYLPFPIAFAAVIAGILIGCKIVESFL